MGSVRRMESSLFIRRIGRRMRHVVSSLATVLLTALVGLFAPDLCAGQSVDASEREALVRLRVDRGGRAEDVDALIRVADEAAAKRLPAQPLTNKIREGLAKGADPKRIELVIRQMAAQLDTADQLLREIESVPASTGREASVTLLAESLGSGVTPDDVRSLRKLAPMSSDSLASASRGLAFIKDAQLPVGEGTAVMAEAVRQGFRSHEILDVGREVKRRESDYRTGRATLRALRDAIARGDRPDQLFRDTRTDPVTRPAAARPETPIERPARPETQRPEQPARPERPPSAGERNR
jgi:hypothetical protein